MPSVSPSLRQRASQLLRAAKTSARARRAELAWAYEMAGLSLSRGDEITAQRWLEKADVERYALRTV